MNGSAANIQPEKQKSILPVASAIFLHSSRTFHFCNFFNERREAILKVLSHKTHVEFLLGATWWLGGDKNSYIVVHVRAYHEYVVCEIDYFES